MDNTVEQYQKIIIDLLESYACLPSLDISGDDIEEQLLIDTQHHHYQLLTVGWENGKRVYYPVFHLDIRNGKIWVQEDATDYDIVGQLEERGVPKSHIVLGFQSPQKRSYTDYATA
ncbi:XisI protein [Fibrella arboris]|uniref:XisI protein n=1 Tax=Fibrella arboris TaxID=3242486 RepID=UPI0035209F77